MALLAMEASMQARGVVRAGLKPAPTRAVVGVGERRRPASSVVSARPHQILREGVGFCRRMLWPLRMTEGGVGCARMAAL